MSSTLSFTKNGLTWSYDKATFFNFDTSNNRGAQIGSSSKPQSTPWTISTDFTEEVIVKEYSVVLATANGGSGKVTVSTGTHQNSGVFESAKTDDFTVISTKGLEEKAQSFSITLQAANQKALYLTQIQLVLDVPPDSSLVLTDTSSDINGTEPNPDPTPDPDPDPKPDVTSDIVPGKGGIPSLNFAPTTVEAYYSGIDIDSADTASLKEEIHDRINRGARTIGYDSTSRMLIYTDESVEDPGYVYGEYDGSLLPAEWDSGKTWNKEHTWPRSRFEDVSGVVDGDLHNLRAANSGINSGRGNDYFDEKGTAGYYPNEGEGDFRGDVARICFYMATRYTGLLLTDAPNNQLGKSMGILTTLLRWNEEDPVSAFERQRNDRIYCYQGNRNPFIDYPELADRFF